MNVVEKGRLSPVIKNIPFILCSLMCYGGTTFMVVMLYCKYQANLDSSQMSMKQFNKSPEGRYPSLTLCLYAKDGLLFKQSILRRDFGLSRGTYYDILNGEMEDTNYTLQKINFHQVVTKIDDFLEEFEAENDAYETYNEWIPSGNTQKSPLIASYQDPTTNCFTYNTRYDTNLTLNAVKVKLNVTKFVQTFDDGGKIYIQAHYPGQMIRDMRTFLFKISDWENINPNKGNNQVLIQFSGVTLMRFRPNGVDACDSQLENDDDEWMEYVKKKLRCTPSYWNKQSEDHHSHDQIKTCSLKEDVRRFKSYWPMDGGRYSTGVFKKYLRPCNKMAIFTNIMQTPYDTKKDVLKIKFRVQENFYQEILNIQDFALEDLWASIGGYVGVFCGYSILHVTTSFIAKVKTIMFSG